MLELTGTLDDEAASSLTVTLLTVTLHDANVYCQTDQVVFGSPNAGLEDNYLYYFEAADPLLLATDASNPLMVLSGCPLSFSLTQSPWSGDGSFDSNIFTIDATTGLIVVSTTDEASFDLDVYTMQVVVTSDLSLDANRQLVATFEITFKSECWDLTLVQPTLAAYEYTFYLFA